MELIDIQTQTQQQLQQSQQQFQQAQQQFQQAQQQIQQAQQQIQSQQIQQAQQQIQHAQQQIQQAQQQIQQQMQQPAQQQSQQQQPINKLEYVQRLIGDNKLIIFSKTYCGFSKRIKQLFKTIDGVTPTIVELDIREDGVEIQSILSEISGIRTVPQLFINGKFIGGNDATQQLHSEGKLIHLLKEAKLL
ncbi:hypothetical protein ACTA71_009933 [Dictyostelium dimigraforme]